MSVSRRRDLFDVGDLPPPPEGLNGHARAWRMTRTALRPWPTVPAAERCDTNGRLILQHRVTGRVRAMAVTCRTWSCPGCGGRKANEVMDKLGAHWKPETEIWWAWSTDRTDRDRLRKQLYRQGSQAHVWIRRKNSYYLFAAGALVRGRRLGQAEALVVARFALRPGVVRVWGPWVAGQLRPIYRRLDFASAYAARAAQDRAEASILATYGVAYSFDEDDPPAGLADAFAAELISALEVSRATFIDPGGEPC